MRGYSVEREGNSAWSDQQDDPFSLMLANRELENGRLFLHDLWYLSVIGSHLIAAYDVYDNWIHQTLAGNQALIGRLDSWLAAGVQLDYLYHLWPHSLPLDYQYRRHSITSEFHGVRNDLWWSRSKEIMNEAKLAFSAHLTMPVKVDWTWDELYSSYLYILKNFIQPINWAYDERKIKVPFVREIPGPGLKGLPLAFNLGGMQFEQRFGRFYVPSQAIRRYPYSMDLFNYMGSDYENVSDITFKNDVFRGFADTLRRWFDYRRINSPTILDVGVGTGLFGQYVRRTEFLSEGIGMNRWQLHGVDFSSRMLESVRTKVDSDNMPLYQALYKTNAAAMIEIATDTYPVAIMSFVEVWLDRQGFKSVMNEIKRVLIPGGMVVFNIHRPEAGRKEQIEEILSRVCGFSKISFWYELCETSDPSKSELVLMCQAVK